MEKLIKKRFTQKYEIIFDGEEKGPWEFDKKTQKIIHYLEKPIKQQGDNFNTIKVYDRGIKLVKEIK